MKPAFFVLLVVTFPLMAQNTATISGTVTDTTGATVPKAQVTATNTGTSLSRSATANDEGQYVIEFLPIGEYQVEVSATGFKKFLRRGLVLEINQKARVDAILAVGAVSETVTVVEAVPLVNTENASLGRTVDNKEITELPIVDRNVYTLLSLTAGVENSTSNSFTLGFPEQRTNINGGLDSGAGSVNYYLDGGSNSTGLRNTGNTAPNPDAVQEFKLITNSYGAEWGRFSGGIVNIITKSGTNALHGSLFEFLRNDKLNAIPWGFASKPVLRRNQFGATLGGPVKKDKLFFFGSYGGLRQISPQLLTGATVPSALERAGDFSQSTTKPRNLATGLIFPNNQIPSALWDPTSVKILGMYQSQGIGIPLPNLPGNLFQGSVANPYQSDEFLAKGDYLMNAKHTITASYYQTNGNTMTQPSNAMPWSIQQFNWRQHNANLGDTWLITPATINQFHLNYTRSFGGRLNLPQTSLGDLGSKFTIQGTPSLPQIAVSGFFTLTQSIAGPTAGTNYYEVRDHVSTTHGRHSLKFGGEMYLQKYVQDTLLNNYGVFSFNTTTGTSNGFASFLMGLPATMNQDTPVTAIDAGWYYGLFIQDDFRVTPRLTLNLGMRYDVQTPPVDPHDRKLTFALGAKSTVVPASLPNLLYPGDPGVGRGIVPADKNNLAPRLGLAWDPLGDGKTSIRAAAGIFYGSISGNEWNTTSNNQPFAIRQQFNAVPSFSSPYVGGVSPFPFNYSPNSPRFILPSSPYGVQSDFVWPYTYQLNFSVQREVVKNTVVTASYVGSLGHRLPFARDLNYPIYNSGATTANVNARRPILPGTLSSILMITSMEQSSYNALQMTFERRAGHFTMKGFYTFSKSLSGVRMGNNTTNGLATDYNNLALDKGRSEFDRRQNFVTSVIFKPDYFGNAGSFLRNTLNGWTVSAIVSLRSGLPFDVQTGSDSNLDGISNDRPLLAGNPVLDANRPRHEATAMWFNTAAFVRQASGITGTTPRNYLSGPGLRNVDMSLFRDFRLWREGWTLQFRAEMTNALNFTNLSQPTATASSANFGKIATAGKMRESQLGLRLRF